MAISISLNIIVEYAFSYLLWKENTCKTHKKQVFQNKYSNSKNENFYFLLLKMISELLHSLTVVEKQLLSVFVFLLKTTSVYGWRIDISLEVMDFLMDYES
jgi:hypothetical protein